MLAARVPAVRPPRARASAAAYAALGAAVVGCGLVDPLAAVVPAVWLLALVLRRVVPGRPSS